MSALRIQCPSLALLVLLSSVPARAQSPSQWKGPVMKEGNVTIVSSPMDPMHMTPILELEEDLALGGPRAEGDYAFGNIRSLAVDEEGSLYVLDEKNNRAQVFDASGKYLRTIGRKGQGPGDLDYPLCLSVNRTSDELLVLQGFRRLSFFRTGGSFVRQLNISDSYRAQIDSRGQIYLLQQARSRTGAWSFDVRKLSMLGTDLGVVASVPGQGYTGKIDPFFPYSYFQVDRSDNLVYGDSRSYEILFFEPSGKLFRRLTRAYSPIPVNEEERTRELDKTPREVRSNLVFPKYHPAFAGFFLSDTGHLFVRTEEGAEGGHVVYDIFDAEGRYVSRIPLKPSGNMILNGKYYATEEDEDGYQYIKRYNVIWKDGSQSN
jgi:hypothetical protein